METRSVTLFQDWQNVHLRRNHGVHCHCVKHHRRFSNPPQSNRSRSRIWLAQTDLDRMFLTSHQPTLLHPRLLAGFTLSPQCDRPQTSSHFPRHRCKQRHVSHHPPSFQPSPNCHPATSATLTRITHWRNIFKYGLLSLSLLTVHFTPSLDYLQNPMTYKPARGAR